MISGNNPKRGNIIYCTALSLDDAARNVIRDPDGMLRDCAYMLRKEIFSTNSTCLKDNFNEHDIIYQMSH